MHACMYVLFQKDMEIEKQFRGEELFEGLKDMDE